MTVETYGVMDHYERKLQLLFMDFHEYFCLRLQINL